MGSLRWQFVSLIASCIIIESLCAPRQYLGTKRKTDAQICAAINRLHRYHPGYMTNEEMCQRYTVLLSLTNGVPNEAYAYWVQIMEKSTLEEHYEKVDLHNKSLLMMAAVDRFRVTKLAPAFIDLVDCIREIDTPSTKAYTENEEIVVIEDLYKQVLGLPNKKIDLRTLNMKKHHPTFRATLGNLFREYFDIDSLFDTSLAPAKDNKRSRLKDYSDFDSDPEEADREMRNAKQRKRYREHQLLQKRERSRLSNQRRRLLEPKWMLKRNRVEQRRSRARLRQQKPTADVERSSQPMDIQRKTWPSRRFRRTKAARLKIRREIDQYLNKLSEREDAQRLDPSCSGGHRFRVDFQAPPEPLNMSHPVPKGPEPAIGRQEMQPIPAHRAGANPTGSTLSTDQNVASFPTFDQLIRNSESQALDEWFEELFEASSPAATQKHIHP